MMTSLRSIFIFFLSLLAIALIPLQGFAQSTSITLNPGNRVYLPLKSLNAIRKEGLVMQAFDYSCGSAALATLLTYGLGEKVREKEVLDFVLKSISQDEKKMREKEGLSLLDLKRFANDRGFRAEGFRLEPKHLSLLQGPVIVFIKPRGYDHFAVLKGLQNGRAYLADPSRGNIRVRVDDFLHMWLEPNGKGIIFVAERQEKAGSFQTPMQPPLKTPRTPAEILSARQLHQIGRITTQTPQILRLTR